MSHHLTSLEDVLRQILAEHRKLVDSLDAQQAGMKTLNLDAMAVAAARQEASRLRLAALENQRKLIALRVAHEFKIQGEVTLARLATLVPARSAALLELRAELRAVMETINNRTQVGARLAGAVLGHLNTVLRLVAGVVERTGVYTRNGVPRVSGRIGVVEAMG